MCDDFDLCEHLDICDFEGDIVRVGSKHVAVLYTPEEDITRDQFEVRFAAVENSTIGDCDIDEHFYQIKVFVDVENDFGETCLSKTKFANMIKNAGQRELYFKDTFSVPSDINLDADVDFDEDSNTIVVMLSVVEDDAEETAEKRENAKESEKDVEQQPSSLGYLIEKLFGEEEDSAKTTEQKINDAITKAEETDPYKKAQEKFSTMEKYWLNGKEVDKKEFDEKYPNFWKDFDHQFKDFDKQFAELNKSFEAMNSMWKYLLK